MAHFRRKHLLSSLLIFLILLSLILSACQSEPPILEVETPVPESLIVGLLSQGKVEVQVAGAGLQLISMQIRRTTPDDIVVVVPAGTYFVSQDPQVQNMMSLQDTQVALTHDDWVNLSVPVACANIDRAVPSGEHSFTIQTAPNQENMTLLAHHLARGSYAYEVSQAAVWIVSDNANYDSLGTLVEGPVVGPGLGGPRLIGPAEAVQAMQLVAEAGINLATRYIWRDRIRLSKELQDQDLGRWLDEYHIALPGRPLDHGDFVSYPAFSPSGTQIAAASCDSHALLNCSTGQVIIWDPATGERLRQIDLPGRLILSLAWSNDGSRLAVGACHINEFSVCGETGEIILLNPHTGDQISSLAGRSDGMPGIARVDFLDFTPTGSLLALGCTTQDCANPWLMEWDLESQPELLLPGLGSPAYGPELSPDGRSVAIPLLDFEGIMIWDLEQQTEVASLHPGTGLLWNVAWDPDGRLLAAASAERELSVWEAGAGRLVAEVTLSPPTGSDPEESMLSSYPELNWSPNGSLWVGLDCALSDGELACNQGGLSRFRSLADTGDTLSLAGSYKGLVVTQFAFSPDGETLAVVENSGALRLFARSEIEP